MFLISKEEKERRAALKKQKEEAAIQRCKMQLARLANASPEQVDAINEVVKAQFKGTGLPKVFREKAKEKLQALSCDVFTKETDKALGMACQFAKGDKRREMRHWIGEARKYIGQAKRYGANPDFIRASEKSIEVLLETGGVSHHGKPTAAKPGGLSEIAHA